MSTLISNRFRTEQARQFHRNFTNTIAVATEQANSVTPINDQVFVFTATAGQTLFTGNDDNGNMLSFLAGKIQVFLNGDRLSEQEYTTDTGNQIELVIPAALGDVLVIAGYTVYSFPNPSDYHYVFIGRTVPWANDLVPPAPENTRLDEAITKNNIVAVKRITGNDVALIVPRIDWTSGVVYDQYVDDENYSDRSFYTMNTSFRIYKCIFSPGSPSLQMPEHTYPGPEYLSDGYCWQLVYEVPAADRVKFLDENYIPVRFFSTSSTFDHNAIIDSIFVVNGGSGYVTAPTVIIMGDGVGATATATVMGGEVTEIIMTNQGSGYTFALIQLVGGSGTGAFAEANLQSSDVPITTNQDVASFALTTAGSIDLVEVVNGGELYLPGTTTIEVIGDGIGALVAPIVNTLTGQISGVQIVDRGRGYTFANLVVTSVTGSGAVIKATIGPEYGHGGNIPKELFAKTVGLSVNIEDMLSDFFLGNDFRQIGIIKNIRDFYKSQVFSQSTGTACYEIVVPLGQVSKYNVDDVVLSDTDGRYIVTNIRGRSIYLLPVVDSIFDTSILENETTGENGLTIETISLPEISTKSGDVIYVKNTTPINRQQGQVEQLKLFFSF